MPYTATILDKDRAKEWHTIFGTNTIHIQSNYTVLAHFPGYADAQQCYFLDLHKLTHEQRRRLTAHLATKFNYPILWVKELLPIHGVPVLAKRIRISRTK